MDNNLSYRTLKNDLQNTPGRALNPAAGVTRNLTGDDVTSYTLSSSSTDTSSTNTSSTNTSSSSSLDLFSFDSNTIYIILGGIVIAYVLIR